MRQLYPQLSISLWKYCQQCVKIGFINYNDMHAPCRVKHKIKQTEKPDHCRNACAVAGPTQTNAQALGLDGQWPADL